jgi:hypothetical protein
VAGRADPARRHRNLARIGLGVGDEFSDGLGRHRRIDLHHQRHLHDVADSYDIPREIEGELPVVRGVDGVRDGREQERVAVRRRVDDIVRGNAAAGARPVLDDELLAEMIRQPLAHQACAYVGRARGREANDQSDRT